VPVTAKEATAHQAGRPLTQRCVAGLAARGADPAELIGLAQASPQLMNAYGDRYLARPVLLESDQVSGLEADLSRLFALLVSLRDRVFGGDLRAMALAGGMAPPQVDAMLRTTFGPPVCLSRADLYQEADGFKVLEFNIVSALGGLDNALLNRALLRHPAIEEFVDAEGLRYVDTMARMAEMIRIECERVGAASRPRVVMVDTPENFPEIDARLTYVAEVWSQMGLDAIACSLGEIEERSGRLYARDQAIDVIYRYFLIEDVIGRDASTIEPMVRAVERQQVGLVTGMDAELYGNKAMLALLTDDEHREVLTVQERAFTDRLLPWSRPLRAGRATAGGQEVDLLAYAAAERENLILKPTLMHGGIGMVPGWTVDHEQWQEALAAAVGGPYVLQRRVRPVTEPFPEPGPPGTVAPQSLNWGVFLIQDAYAGTIVRGSADPDVGVVSMNSGARVGCCFHQPMA
jgi:glutathionylspermidine synthase